MMAIGSPQRGHRGAKRCVGLGWVLNVVYVAWFAVLWGLIFGLFWPSFLTSVVSSLSALVAP